jgi:ABC-type nitrate/sulfonate/bicarbonate transport system ATPase subunit
VAAIEVEALVHDHGRGPTAVRALDGTTLRVGVGEFVGVVGPSGCGKSTLLRILAGLLTPTEGRAEVDGRAAYMPQRDALLPWRRSVDNATLGAVIGGVPRRDAEARAAALLDDFGLAGFERSWPSQLSGGMRQRLALLRTFLTPSEVLLLDEPFGALDAITRRRFQGWLEEVWLADRRAVAFVTHDVEEALVLADRVLVMSPRPGRIVAEVDCPFPRPRPPGLVTDPTLVARKAALLDALDA